MLALAPAAALAAPATVAIENFSAAGKDLGAVRVPKVVKSEAGSLLEVDHEKNSLFFRAVVGASSDRVSNFVIPMGQGVVGHVAGTAICRPSKRSACATSNTGHTVVRPSLSRPGDCHGASGSPSPRA